MTRFAVWLFAAVVVLVVCLMFIAECESAYRERTEVTPVLEATTPESTGPAESEEDTVADDLPATGGIKLAKLGGE